MKLLIVENDPNDTGLQPALGRGRHAGDLRIDGRFASQAIGLADYDYAMFDLGLPDIDGIQRVGLMPPNPQPDRPLGQ